MSSKRKHTLLCEMEDGTAVNLVIRDKRKRELTVANIVKDYPRVVKILTIQEMKKPSLFSPATYNDLMQGPRTYHTDKTKRKKVQVVR